LALTSFGTSSTYKGLYCLTHDGTNDIVYKNGSKTSAVATPQAPALSQPFFILAKNAAGAVQERFTNAYVAYTFFFNRFNDSDESSLRTILTTYNTAAGLP
jgi:hypothetical protein